MKVMHQNSCQRNISNFLIKYQRLVENEKIRLVKSDYKDFLFYLRYDG